MKKACAKLAATITVLLLILTATGCGNSNAYVIGATGPLSGDIARYGKSVKQGAQMAVEEINQSGGLNGHPFVLKMINDKNTAKKAKNGYESLYKAGMQLSLGSVTSDPSNSFVKSASEDKVFILSPSAAYSEAFDTVGNAFSVAADTEEQGILAAKKLSADYTNIGCLYRVDNAYSTAVFEAFFGELKRLDKSCTIQSFEGEDCKKFSFQVDKLKECDVIFLPLYCDEAGRILNTCAALDVNVDIFGCDGLEGIEDHISDKVKNRIQFMTTFNSKSTDKLATVFAFNYNKKYGTDPDQFAANAYDAVYVLYEAMDRAGISDPTVSPDDLSAALISIITDEDFSYSGVTGELKWDRYGNGDRELFITEVTRS